MLNKSIFGLGLGLSLLLSACGGPESDFRKLGHLACEMQTEVARLNKKYPNLNTDEKEQEAALKELESFKKRAEALQKSLEEKYQKQMDSDQVFAQKMLKIVEEEMKKCGLAAPTENVGENSNKQERNGVDDAIRLMEAMSKMDKEDEKQPLNIPNAPEMPELPETENSVSTNSSSSSKQVTTSTRTESVTINGKTTSKTTTTSTTVTNNN